MTLLCSRRAAVFGVLAAGVPFAACGKEDWLPVPQRTIAVRDGSGLAKALTEARAGDLILLEAGTYDVADEFICEAGGSPQAPIVIESVEPMQAQLRRGLVVTGASTIVRGVSSEGASVTVGGDDSRVTRCRVHGTNGRAIVITHGRGVRVDRCDVSSRRQGICVKLDARYPTLVLEPRIERNWLHDFPGHRGENGHEGIQVGQTKRHTDFRVGAIVERNLLENVSIDPECISVKSSGNIVRENTLFHCSGSIVNRHGHSNQYLANWIENSGGIRIHDQGNIVAGNWIRGPRAALRIMGGDISPEDWPGDVKRTAHPYAEDTLVVGNDSDALILGAAFTGHDLPPRGTRIEAHLGKIITEVETDAVVLDVASISVPVPVRVGRREVGPSAA